MTDIEFEIIDQLYFVVEWKRLKENVSIPEDELNSMLFDMIQKGWVRCMDKQTEATIESPSLLQFKNNLDSYLFLVSKTGLKLHNSI